MATQIHRTWGEIVGEAKSLHVDLMEVYQNSPIARIDIDCPGGNEAWFFRDEADWLAWEDFDREVSLDEPGVACVDPCEGKPRMCIACATEEEFLEAVFAVKYGGYHGGCLFEPV
jgi:hypothetical protein